jgi:hypothetical protein
MTAHYALPAVVECCVIALMCYLVAAFSVRVRWW